jgi:benzoate membrane transport protein
MSLEKPILPLPSPRRVAGDLAPVFAASGLAGFVFAASGPVAIVLAVGTRGGLTEAEMASWIFGSFFLNGLLTIGFSLAWRQPLAFFWTIPGTVLVGPALGHLSFAEVIGAFLVTGLLMLVLGLTGWVRKAMEAVPMPIVMGMVAGVFLRFGLDWVLAFRDAFWIAAPMTAVFIGLMAWPAAARYFPPLIAALVVGIVAVLATGAFAPDADLSLTLAAPVIHTPEFSWQAMVELVVPLAITVLVVQNGQGIAILTAAGHRPPTNAITVACGAMSMICGLVGTVSTCLTGPVNAILSSAGDRDRQYVGGVVVGLLAVVFGLLAPVFTRFMLATPGAFIATLAGLAMLRVLQAAFTTAFGGKFTLGALVTFLVTVSDIAIFNIGAPFWGLVFGFALSFLVERDDFRPDAGTP